MTDPVADLAVEFVLAGHMTAQSGPRTVHLRTGELGKPVISRIDRDDEGGPVLVYFEVANESFFLVVAVDEGRPAEVAYVRLEAGTEVSLEVRSDSRPLEELRAAVPSIVPTEEWDNRANKGTSGFSFQAGVPLADGAEDNLLKLIDELEEHIEDIRRLGTLGEAWIQLNWYGTGYLPDVALAPSTLARMARLGLGLRIAISISDNC